jgi:glycosyltransferase involved in cell wall biosynthesis
MISIVVPAHNESSVIVRTLNPWIGALDAGELSVVIVCNGCTDDTAALVRGFGHRVRLIESEIPSKTNALNMGDQASSDFPRIYVDADVVLSLDAIRALAKRLGQGDKMAVAPTPDIDLAGCSRMVRLYFDIRHLLPSSTHGIGGSGVYALSEAGRRRFDQFPEVIADDTFVRLQFRPEEREMVTAARSVVFPPRTIRQLIAVRTRAYAGSLEIKRRFPMLQDNNGATNEKALLSLFKYPRLWLGLSIYCFVNLAARYRAHVRSQTTVWHRDDTSRCPLPT